MNCSGCQREIEVGDRFIKDTATGFIGKDADPLIDSLIADIFGGTDGEVVYCEDCTQDGGSYMWETNYGDQGTP